MLETFAGALKSRSLNVGQARPCREIAICPSCSTARLTVFQADGQHCWVLGCEGHEFPEVLVSVGEGEGITGQVLLDVTGVIHLEEVVESSS